MLRLAFVGWYIADSVLRLEVDVIEIRPLMPELTEGISSNAGKRKARSMKPLSDAGRKKCVMVVGLNAGVLGLR